MAMAMNYEPLSELGLAQDISQFFGASYGTRIFIVIR
jgi:hypothetical protein